MKVLHVTNKPIFPTVDGGCVAMQRTLQCLQMCGYEVVHLCISTQKHPFNKKAYPEGINVHSIEIDTRLNPFSALGNLMKGRSYHLSRFRSEAIRDKIVEILKDGEFHIVLFESIYSAAFIEDARKHSNASIWIRTHNVESQIWKEVADGEKNPLRKWYLNRLSIQLQKEELELLNEADGILAISEVDKAQFENLEVKTDIKVIHVPFSVDVRKLDYSASTFYFIGSMNWEPNREAVNILLESIWPKINEYITDSKLILVGNGMEKFVSTNENKGIEVRGFVEDLNEIYLNEGIFLCPIYSGSGVRIKLLEAMSKGAPVITTKKGAEGIIADHKIFLEVTDDSDFAAAAIELAKDMEQRSQLGDSAYYFMSANYSIESVSKKIDGIFKNR